jgi:hypothetical protein
MLLSLLYSAVFQSLWELSLCWSFGGGVGVSQMHVCTAERYFLPHDCWHAIRLCHKVQPAFHGVGCCVKAVVSWPLSDCVLHQLAVKRGLLIGLQPVNGATQQTPGHLPQGTLCFCCSKQHDWLSSHCFWLDTSFHVASFSIWDSKAARLWLEYF